jgi:hypothetical protein
MKYIPVNLLFIFIQLFFIQFSSISLLKANNYPPPACVEYENLTLTICPPSPLPDPPVQLLAYNIYSNDEFIENIPLSPPFDTLVYFLDGSQIIPGENNFCVRAVYSDWVSEPACDLDTVIFGFDLPFFEDWSSGDLESNNWIAEGDNWEIISDDGNPLPAAAFEGQPGLTNYSHTLESYCFIADTLMVRDIYVEYDFKLESINNTGDERLRLEVWNWDSQSWGGFSMHSNSNGSFDWIHERRFLGTYALGKIFKIRFLAYGLNSADIVRWSVDNINIYRACKAPEDLQVNLMPDENRKLHWYGIYPNYPVTYHWDDGSNYTSIGTGGAVEFEVAARWTPMQLADLDGYVITAVYFVPGEEDAQYSIRIWEVDTAMEMLVDQPVLYPEIAEWNVVYLDSLIRINSSKELWIGYYVNTPTGYPAGCDDGPAIDGYGNMMNYGGWQTLLEINPELDYNWNIQFKPASYIPDFRNVNIFRQTDFTGDFEWVASTGNPFVYYDTSTVAGEVYCYKINAEYIHESDTCLSDFSDIVCDDVIPQAPENERPKHFADIFPNPAKQTLNIISDEDIALVELFNSLGMNILSFKYPSSNLTIPVSNVPQGLYIVRVKAKSGEITRKVLIIK